MNKKIIMYVIINLTLIHQITRARILVPATEQGSVLEVEPFLKSSVSLDNIKHNIIILLQKKEFQKNELENYIDTVDTKIVKPLKQVWNDLSIDYHTRITTYENAINQSRQKADTVQWKEAIADMRRLLHRIEITIDELLDYNKSQSPAGSTEVNITKKNRAAV